MSGISGLKDDYVIFSEMSHLLSLITLSVSLYSSLSTSDEIVPLHINFIFDVHVGETYLFICKKAFHAFQVQIQITQLNIVLK